MAREQDKVARAQLRVLFEYGTTAGLTDGQLLERFTIRRGEVAELAFAALVERHGPMVLGACRKVLGDHHEAEDAFQATFLVLASMGRSLWVRDSLGPWLHRVACRNALRARLAASRRGEAERRAAERAGGRSGGEARDDLGRALHEEIDRLPGLYRLSVVLCDLEGRTYEEAARHLGCPVGTIKSRLARGRERLRERLTRRGLAPSAGLLAANPTRAAASPLLSDLAVKAAMRIAAGPTAAGMVQGSVAALAREMLRMMFITRLAKSVGAVLAVGLLAAGMGMIVHRSAGAPARHARAGGAEKKVAPPASKGEGGPGEIIARVANISRDNRGEFSASMVAVDPETGTWRTIARGLPAGPVSPDGRYIVHSQPGRDHAPAELGIRVYDSTGREPTRRVFERNGVPRWSDDGRRVVIGVPVGEIGVAIGEQKFETWVVNADGTGRARLPIPDTDLVFDCSSDGTWLATRTIGGEPAHRGRMRLVRLDGTGARTLTEGSAKEDIFTIFQISPDGRSIAYVEIRTVDDVRQSRLFVMDVEDKGRREIPMAFDPGTTVSVQWSPDGSRLALNGMSDRTKEGSIALVNLDGSKFRTLPLPAGKWNLHVCDWKALAPGLRVADLERVSAEDARTPRGRYQALREEVKKANPFDPRAFLGRFLELADSAPEDGAAVDALIWVIQYGSGGPVVSRAIDRLAERHADGLKVGRAASSLARSVSPSAEKLLRAVIEKNPARPVKGRAILSLGRYWKHQAEIVRALKDDPEGAKSWEALFAGDGSDGADYARFAGRDPDALMKEAEAVLERTAEQYGDLVDGRFRTVGEAARAELDEIRNLRVGKPAPEIAGEDAAGGRFSLGDSRGKVVVVSFWADWCASCRGMYQYERSLAGRMQGRPFALLGVNGDPDRDKLRDLMEREGLAWRSWWDGGGDANTAGPIARRYNVDAWPTLYVLDHRGIIRHKSLGSPGTKTLDSVIDALVKAAEEAADPPK